MAEAEENLTDGDLQSEIELVGDLVVAATSSDGPLTQDEIDRLLGVHPGENPSEEPVEAPTQGSTSGTSTSGSSTAGSSTSGTSTAGSTETSAAETDR